MRLGHFVEQQPGRAACEINLCGVLVHARPDKLAAVRASLESIDGVEVHHAEPDGRIIVTVEDAGGRWAGSIVTSFQEIEGVLTFALVYHHTLGDLEEEGMQ